MKRFGLILLLTILHASGGAELHWSLRPLAERPAPIPTDQEHWSRTPIDGFILAKLREHGFHPSAPASKRVLLRRVYFDLIGLPPTPAELRAFVADSSPEAFARVVDRLLDRPEYGERWARHWLDLAHYAESHGNDQDRMRTNAWPYRDYVIASFNADKPYARFVQEQVAGDAMFPGSPEATVAMGFLASGPWDESSLRDIREDSIDRQIARYVDRDDIVSTVMNTFASTTVQCARCHDHKFDPISQREYYGLQAVFAGIEKGNREYDTDPKVHLRRQALAQRLRSIEALDEETRTTLLGADFQARVREWENGIRKESVLWTVLAPTSAISSNGSTLSLRSDNTVFSGGERPETDTYTVEATTPEALSAVRLETLREESLNTKGPGRQDNGNFHLTDFRLFIVAVDGGAKEVGWKRAFADFDQEGWGAAKAIDGDPKTGWGVYPQIGQTHAAVFETAEEVPAGSVLRFVLAQNHGTGHIIKRVRLSATSGTIPGRLRLFPDEIQSLLLIPERSRDQEARLAQYYARMETEAALSALPAPSVVYAGARYFLPDGGHIPAAKVRTVELLKRGDIHQPLEVAQPEALGFQAQLPGDLGVDAESEEGARREALARWLTDPRNGIVWRSIVNRIWQYHFGRGLVSTPNDFGRMGAEPSHPELLDWLAVWFRDHGGSFKKLHRLILTSAVYQQACEDHPEFAAEDADNVYLWRMNRSRLDAEGIRDTILAVSGRLDRRMGGASDQMFSLAPGIHVTPKVDYAAFDVDAPAAHRRSIYRFVFRTLPDPLMDALGCPDPSQLTPVRNDTVTIGQSLALWNDQFTLRYSEHFAERLEKLAPAGLDEQIALACEKLLCRPIRPSEASHWVAFARTHGLPSLCRVLFNSNEFVFIN